MFEGGSPAAHIGVPSAAPNEWGGHLERRAGRVGT